MFIFACESHRDRRFAYDDAGDITCQDCWHTHIDEQMPRKRGARVLHALGRGLRTAAYVVSPDPIALVDAELVRAARESLSESFIGALFRGGG